MRCPNCGSFDVFNVGGNYPGGLPLFACHVCGWKNYSSMINAEKTEDRVSEFMDAVVNIGKRIKGYRGASNGK